METIIKKIDRNNIQEEDFKEASDIINKGGLVAFPTETVYGLGADALNEQAAARIYAAKGRPSDNPLIVHIADIAALNELASDVPDIAYELADAFWPGPLTIILNKSGLVPKGTTGGLETVAIRMPSDKIAAALIKYSNKYIAAPSANTSGRPSTTKAEHVIEDLDGKIDMIIDGGASDIGLESTIVDLTGEFPVILRPGYITKDELEAVVGYVEYDKAVLNREANTNIVAKAPGMKYRHYAPKAELFIVEGSMEDTIECINKNVKEKEMLGFKTGVIATDETKNMYHGGIVKSLGSRNNELSITSALFDILREFDTIEARYIYTESFDGLEHGQAVMNRLLKAAGYHIINA